MCSSAQSAHFSELSIPLHAASIDPPEAVFPVFTFAVAHAVRMRAVVRRKGVRGIVSVERVGGEKKAEGRKQTAGNRSTK
jgi:hypothetical protein